VMRTSAGMHNCARRRGCGQAQDAYTDAMADGYRERVTEKVLDDEAERSALTEALLQARISDNRSLWEIAQLVKLPQNGPYVVVAATCPDVGKQALPGVAAKLRGSTGRVTVFEDSVLAVAADSAPEVSDKLADTILGRFDDLPIDERDVLYDTFRAWMDNDGSVAKAAARLYCHPNTVRYRLRRIEQRTGRSLSVPQSLAELCLAFEIYWHGW
jgi:hypothetical protein